MDDDKSYCVLPLEAPTQAGAEKIWNEGGNLKFLLRFLHKLQLHTSRLEYSSLILLLPSGSI